MRLKALARSGAWILAGFFFGVWSTLRRLRCGRREPPALGRVRSILAIRLDLMGDLIFTLPAVRALREAAPQARISLLALPYTAELARGLPYVDRVIAVDVNRWRRPGEWIRGRAWREFRRAVAEIRAEAPDLCVSFYGRVGATFALLSGARFLVGYGGEGYRSTFDMPIAGKRYRIRRHETEYCLNLVRALGAVNPGKQELLVVDPEATTQVRRLLSGLGIAASERLVALHPGALNTPIKRWLPEGWAAVADRVQGELGCRVVLVGSGSELSLADRVVRHMKSPVVVLTGKTSLSQLAALLARCHLFLGGDSGPLHLASALGVPSVSVYGPTDPVVTGAVGSRGVARVVVAGVECSPCYDPEHRPECRRRDLLCMHQVTADQVFNAVKEVLNRTPLPLSTHRAAPGTRNSGLSTQDS